MAINNIHYLTLSSLMNNLRSITGPILPIGSLWLQVFEVKAKTTTTMALCGENWSTTLTKIRSLGSRLCLFVRNT